MPSSERHRSHVAAPYKEARPWAAAIREAVLMRKMPPWKADPHYGKWSNDPTLSQAEIEKLNHG